MVHKLWMLSPILWMFLVINTGLLTYLIDIVIQEKYQERKKFVGFLYFLLGFFLVSVLAFSTLLFWYGVSSLEITAIVMLVIVACVTIAVLATRPHVNDKERFTNTTDAITAFTALIVVMCVSLYLTYRKEIANGYNMMRINRIFVQVESLLHPPHYGPDAA